MAERKYRLGEYEFDSYEEYLEGEEDLKKIDIITEEVDIRDVDVAARLYTKIRNKEVVFKGKVGVNFFMNLADIVVNHSINLAEEKRKAEEKKKKNKKAQTAYICAGAACIVAAIVCFGVFYNIDKENEQSEMKFAMLRETKNMTGSEVGTDEVSEDAVESIIPDTTKPETTQTNENEVQDNTHSAESGTIDESKLNVLKEYKALNVANQEMVGWLSIPGTNIDYPVMQSKEEDGQYYLTHNFYRESDSNGSLFMDYRNDYVNRDTNIIIYGHNMRSGAMFGNLKSYLDESFLNEHKTISFDTIYERGTYEVIGAFLSKVNNESDYAFRYYNFLNVASEAEYDAFKVNVMQMDALNRGSIDTNYGDKLLTLSTCSSYTEDGRMFIIAKKIK